MDNYLQKGFYAKRTSCNFRYSLSFFKNEIDENDITIDNLEKEIIYCKNNLIHKIIIVLANMMKNLLKIKEKVNMYKSIVVVIEYEGQNVFMGNLNFTGLD